VGGKAVVRRVKLITHVKPSFLDNVILHGNGVQILVEALPHLINCCTASKDFHAAAHYLRRMYDVILEVYPQNYPEIADYASSIAMSLQRLAVRSQRTAAINTREIRSMLQNTVDVRTVALGVVHPLTQEARESLAEVSF